MAKRAYARGLDFAVFSPFWQSPGHDERRPLHPAPRLSVDPFLFCVHHNDAYPAGNDALGLLASSPW